MTFGFNFNQPINLPPDLHSVTFGHKFSQHVNLPHKLINLTLEKSYSHPINLGNITHLKINSNNQNIIDYLPNSLKKLF